MDNRILLALLILALALAGSAANAATRLTAGAATVDITPSLQRFPTISLGGFGERNGKPAQSVHDPICARALVLSDGRTRLALVSTDLLMIGPTFRDAVLKQVADLGFTRRNLLLAAAHNHSAPECLHPAGDVRPLAFGKFHPEFFAWTAQRIAEAIRQACADMGPAAVGFASRQLPGFNRNRRETGGGLADQALTVMKVTRPGRAEPLALLVNFTAHPTMKGEDSFDISGEWPGAMARALEARTNGKMTVLYFNGAQGDQTTAGDFGSGWERIANYGNALAEQVWALAAKAKPSPDARLGISTLTWKLPPQQVSPAFIESTGQEYKLSVEAANQLIGLLFPSRAPLQAIRIGEGLLMAIPGEAIAELGLAMKKQASQLGARYPMAIGLANDHISYILSREQYEEGGYESGTSFYGPDLGPMLVSKMAGVVKSLYR